MAIGALVGAYQEDESGGLRALYPLAGQTLVEYQVRCAAAAGASPILLIVDRIPPALNEALERLEREGLSVTTVSDGNEAATRFAAGEMVLMLADGVAPSIDLLASIAEEGEPTVVTVPDDPAHQHFERRIKWPSRNAVGPIKNFVSRRALCHHHSPFGVYRTLKRLLPSGEYGS